MTPRKTNLG